jgi:hypothetical protein
MPLHNVYLPLLSARQRKAKPTSSAYTYQSMCFCLPPAVKPKDWIVPCIKEIVCPRAGSNDHAPRLESLGVLRKDELDPFRRDVTVGLDNGVRGNDRGFASHDGAQARRVRDVFLEGHRGVHDDGILVEVPEVVRVLV